MKSCFCTSTLLNRLGKQSHNNTFVEHENWIAVVIFSLYVSIELAHDSFHVTPHDVHGWNRCECFLSCILVFQSAAKRIQAVVQQMTIDIALVLPGNSALLYSYCRFSHKKHSRSDSRNGCKLYQVSGWTYRWRRHAYHQRQQIVVRFVFSVDQNTILPTQSNDLCHICENLVQIPGSELHQMAFGWSAERERGGERGGERDRERGGE